MDFHQNLKNYLITHFEEPVLFDQIKPQVYNHVEYNAWNKVDAEVWTWLFPTQATLGEVMEQSNQG